MSGKHNYNTRSSKTDTESIYQTESEENHESDPENGNNPLVNNSVSEVLNETVIQKPFTPPNIDMDSNRAEDSLTNNNDNPNGNEQHAGFSGTGAGDNTQLPYVPKTNIERHSVSEASDTDEDVLNEETRKAYEELNQMTLFEREYQAHHKGLKKQEKVLKLKKLREELEKRKGRLHNQVDKDTLRFAHLRQELNKPNEFKLEESKESDSDGEFRELDRRLRESETRVLEALTLERQEKQQMKEALKAELVRKTEANKKMLNDVQMRRLNTYEQSDLDRKEGIERREREALDKAREITTHVLRDQQLLTHSNVQTGCRVGDVSTDTELTPDPKILDSSRPQFSKRPERQHKSKERGDNIPNSVSAVENSSEAVLLKFLENQTRMFTEALNKQSKSGPALKPVFDKRKVLPFNGTSANAYDWLHEYNRVAAHSQWDEAFKIKDVGFQMTDSAKHWYDGVFGDLPQDWDDFETQFKEEFMPINMKKQLQADLWNARQLENESPTEYLRRVLKLSKRVDENMDQSEFCF